MNSVHTVYEVIVVAEELDGKGLFVSLLGVAIKMDLNLGKSQNGPEVASEGEFAGGFSISKNMLGFGVREGSMEAGMLTDCSA